MPDAASHKKRDNETLPTKLLPETVPGRTERDKEILRRSTSRFFFVWSAVLALCGCAASRERVEMGPFYAKRTFAESGSKEWSALWPLLDGYENEKARQFGLRPLLNLRTASGSRPSENLNELQALWPLFLYRETEGAKKKTIRLFPLFFHRQYAHPEGKEESDTALVPFLWHGRSSDGRENYFALFPLGGTLRGFFAKDRIRFVLFPLYADTSEGEHRSYHVLWPFFRYSSGGGKSSFRVWPFYGTKKKEDRYEKTFVLWPFYVRVRERLGSDHPLDSWYLLPFYGDQQTAFGRIRYFLYPFFSYQRSERPGHRFREWQAPWPLFSIARGDRYRKTWIWPFWGTEERGSYHRDMVAYPLYWHSAYRSADGVDERRYLLPFFWSRRVEDEKGQAQQSRVKIWPFVSWSRSGETVFSLETLSLLWFRDPDGFERNYGPLWTWYRRSVSESAATRTRLFWYEWQTRPKAGSGVEDAPPDQAVTPGEPDREFALASSETEEELEGPDPPGLGRLGELLSDAIGD